MNDPECFVLSWSFSQRAFDVQPLDDVLARNLETFRVYCGADYIPMGVYPTRNEASAARRELERWLPDRKMRDEPA